MVVSPYWENVPDPKYPDGYVQQTAQRGWYSDRTHKRYTTEAEARAADQGKAYTAPGAGEAGKEYYGGDPKYGEVEKGAATYSLLSSDDDVASSGNTYKVGTGPRPSLKAGAYTPDQAAFARQKEHLHQPTKGTKDTIPKLEKPTITSQADEKLTTEGKLLDRTKDKGIEAKTASETGLDVGQPDKFVFDEAQAATVKEADIRDVDAQTTELTYQLQHIDKSVSEESIAQAQIEELDNKATVKFQLEQLYEGFKDGNIPSWATAPIRTAVNIMQKRGLGASSMAAAAIAQAIQEGAIPIAQSDAQAYATLQLQNLNNKQQATLANAATYAAMDRANLDARTTALVTNSQNFLAIDLANLTNEQQTEVFNAEARNQFLLSNQAAENAMEQLNTKNQVEIDKFFTQLGVQIEEANSTRNSAIRQFNADQENTLEIFNVKTRDQRERFNAEMQAQIEAANSQWERQITTINNANQMAVNQFAAQSQLTYDLTEYQQLWQQYRDDAARIFTTSENKQDRSTNVAIAQLTSNDNRAARKQSGKNALIGGVASIAGSILGAFSDIRLKTNIQKIGNLSSGLGVYTWEWNDIAKQMNISDTTTGVLAQEVLEYDPSLVIMTSSGYLKVNYEGLI